MQTPPVQKRHRSRLLALLSVRRTTFDSESREFCQIHVELNDGRSQILPNDQILYVVHERNGVESTEDENAREGIDGLDEFVLLEMRELSCRK
jgi:hypothetical protein